MSCRTPDTFRPNSTALFGLALFMFLCMAHGGVLAQGKPVVANAGLDRTVLVGETVTLDASRSTSPISSTVNMTYQWQFVSKPAGSIATLTDASTLSPGFVVDLPGDYEIEVTTSNAQTTDSDRVLISTSNSVPVADAGRPELLVQGTTVQLDGSRSHDDDGDQLSYSWSLQAPTGSAAALSDPSALRPSFFVDMPGDYVAELVVSDGQSSSAPHQVPLSTDHLDVVAEAGPHWRGTVGEILPFGDRFSSHPLHERMLYDWQLIHSPAGSAGTLYEGDFLDYRVTLVVDAPGTYVVEARVGPFPGGESVHDTVIVSTEQSPPTAHAGPDQTAANGATIELDGAGSYDADGNLLGFRWALIARPPGSAAALDDASSVRPSFTLDQAGTYVAQLIVHDGSQPSHPDTVVVTTENSRPVALAGSDRVVVLGEIVQLDGSGSSDADGDTLTYHWTLLTHPGIPAIPLSDPLVVNPTFEVTRVNSPYAVQLVVSDGELVSEPSIVHFTPFNVRAVADAGVDQIASLGDVVQLDGSGSSDFNGDPLGYRWALIAKPAGSVASISDPAIVNPSFVADQPGIYVAQLFARDAIAESFVDTVAVEVPGGVPVAVATATPETLLVGETITLDGSGSFDPNSDPLTYAWSVLVRPEASTAVIAGPTMQVTNFIPDEPGDYTFELVVSDGQLNSLADSASATAIAITNEPPVLDAVGNQTIALGSTLQIQITASDPNDDLLSFIATPVPLPEGLSLDGQSGLLTWRPATDQVGDIGLTLTVSDGFLTDQEEITVTVEAPPPGTTTTLTARVLDGTSFQQGTTEPVEGATVTITGTALSTTTDLDGFFTLSDIPASADQLVIDGATAVPFPEPVPDGTPYGGANAQLDLIADAVNVPLAPYVLPRLTAGACVPVAAGSATTVINGELGATLDVPADAAFDDAGAPFAGELCLASLPPEPTPAVVPPSFLPCQILTVQPQGVTFNPVAQLTFPNLDNLDEGSEVDIWALDPNSGQFEVVGTGEVIAGEIVMTSGGLAHATAVTAVPPAPMVVLSEDHNDFNVQPTALADGNFSTSITTPSYRSLDQERAVTLVYNSANAAPSPILAADTTISARAAVPPLLSASLDLAGAIVAGPVFTSTQDPAPLAFGADHILRLGLTFDAQTIETGRYPARFEATARYGCSQVSGETFGAVLVNNESESPLGAGWTVAGLQELTEQDDGRVVITEGDGRAVVFSPFSAVDVTGEGGQLLSPPSSVVAGATQNAGEVLIFRERRNTILAADLEVEGVRPATYNGTGDLQSVILPAGLTVNSHLIHFNPPATGGAAITATFQFSNDILGLIITNPSLDASDVPLGAPGTAYPAPGTSRSIRFPESELAVLAPDLRTVTVTMRPEDALDQLRVVTMGDVTPQIQESFDVDKAGWDVEGDFLADSFVHVADGGNPGGHLRAEDTASGPVLYWLAPTSYHGDRSSAYGGLLTFDLRQSNPVSPFERDEVELAGASLTLVFNTTYDPSSDWTHYAVPLVEGAGWTLQGTSTVPSQAQFQAVLGDLTRLAIRGEYRSGDPDIIFLDNPAILSPVPGATLAGDFSRTAGDFSALTRNGDGTFTRRLKDGTEIVFNDEGQQVSETDRNGNTTTYAYGAFGRLETITDPTGAVTTFSYDSGVIETIADPAGRVTSFEVDAEGNIIRVISPDASDRLFGYEDGGRLSTETSEREFLTQHSYGFADQFVGSSFPDGSSVAISIGKGLGLANLGIGLGTESNPVSFDLPEDRSTTFTDPLGGVYQFRLNNFGSVVELIDPINRVTSVTRNDDDLVVQIDAPTDGELPDGTKPGFVRTELDYDDRGNVLSLREAVNTPLERQVQFEYEPTFNSLVRTVDPAGNPTTLTYSSSGNLIRIVDAEGGEQVFTYTQDGRGLRESAQDANQNLTQFTYDTNGNLVLVKDGENNETLMLRDEFGRVAARTEGFGTPEAITVTFEYDVMNRQISETNAEDQVTQTLYDSEGNLTEIVDATNFSILREFDEVGRMVRQDNPNENMATWLYDANGNLKTVVGASPNQTMSLFYDAFNRLVRTVDALNEERQYIYDAQNKISEVIDANGNKTTFANDVLGRQIRRTNVLGETWNIAYDSRNNPIQVEDPKNQKLVTEYDALSRVVTITTYTAAGAVEDVISFGYDAVGNLITATDSDTVLTYTYDRLNRLESTSTTGSAEQPGVTLTNVYDSVGNRRQLLDNVGGAASFSYDRADRLIQLTTTSSDTVEFAYDPAGRPASVTYPNLMVSEFVYSQGDRLESITHRRNQTELERLEYSFFDGGVVQQIQEAARTVTYQYDSFLQLVSGGTITSPESYTYDPEGNRLLSHLSATHTYDGANRLLSDDAMCFGYDTNGNLTTRTKKIAGACTGDTTVFTYDVQNRLVQIEFANGDVAKYGYDAFGRRTSKEVSAVLTTYVYDGDAIALEFDETGSLAARYSHSNNLDDPVVLERAGQSYYYHSDHLGSIQLLTDSLGNVANSYSYDSFGRFGTRSETVPNPFAFTGREYDAESGLLFYRARYYDPDIGRFISEDPIGFESGDLNLYRYVFNSPANLIDPKGTDLRTWIGSLNVPARSGLAMARAGRALDRVFASVINKLPRSLRSRIGYPRETRPNNGGIPQPRDNSGRWLSYCENPGPVTAVTNSLVYNYGAGFCGFVDGEKGSPPKPPATPFKEGKTAYYVGYAAGVLWFIGKSLVKLYLKTKGF